MKTLKGNLTLKIGNLIIAIILATIPTLITYGILGIHVMNVCRRLDNNIQNKAQIVNLQKSCNQQAWETTSSYIILIGFFITLPTWYWFYMSMKMKKK